MDVIKNSRLNKLLIEKAIDEIQSNRFGLTEQLLKIHDVVYVDGNPHVLRVDTDYDNETAIVYFPIKDEIFYLAIRLDIKPEISVSGVGTENHSAVYLKVISADLSFTELASLTTLKPTRGWTKGDARKFGKSFYTFTALHVEPNPEPDAFEDKLRKLLDFLETDREGVHALAGKAYVEIAAVITCHNGNTVLGGPHLDRNTVKRLAALNLAIDFDLCAAGNFFED